MTVPLQPPSQSRPFHRIGCSGQGTELVVGKPTIGRLWFCQSCLRELSSSCIVNNGKVIDTA